MEKKYLVLARKYRPKIFKDIIGQEHISTTLQNSIINNKLHHSLIFSGQRGTGKTTTARLVAKLLNCLNPQKNEPCNKCDNCKSILNGNFPDVYELDGATHTGIDKIRELIETVKYMPISGKYKVYIIDEFHMLSVSSFNALLKTLEEPPANTIFILATTELHKVPKTIISRSVVFGFKRIPAGLICNALEKICKKEKFKYDKKALFLIARFSDGSIRDSQSILEQIAAFNNNEINETAIIDNFGITGFDDLFKLLDCIINNDFENAIIILRKSYNSGKDISNIFKEFNNFIRTIMLLKINKKLDEFSDFPAEINKQLFSYCSSFEIKDLIYISEKIYALLKELTISYNVLYLSEFYITKLINYYNFSAGTDTVKQPEISRQKKSISKKSTGATKSAPAFNYKKQWEEVMSNISKINKPLFAYFKPALIELDGFTLKIIFPEKFNFHYNAITKDSGLNTVFEQEFNKVFPKDIDFEIIYNKKEIKENKKEEMPEFVKNARDLFGEDDDD